VSYCERCHHEYAETVEFCLDCGRRLKPGNRPVKLPLDASDFFIPVGALLCAFFAMGLLYLRLGAQAGWISGPLAQMIVITQPPILTVFYAGALVASIIVLALWALNIFVLRR